MIGNRLDNVESYRAHTIKYDNIWVNIWENEDWHQPDKLDLSNKWWKGELEFQPEECGFGQPNRYCNSTNTNLDLAKRNIDKYR